MSFGLEYFNWQAAPPAVVRRHCSPNLLQIRDGLVAKWPGFTNMGCYGARPIRGGTAPSSHSYGSAIDIGYPAEADDLVAAEVLPWLVGWSHECHVSAIHDYRRCRIWHAGRTTAEDDACSLWWKAQRASSSTGMGQTWANHLHIETTFTGWSDGSPLSERFSDGA